MKIKIVVPAHNEGKNITHVLESINSALIPSEVELSCTVVINGCEDNTAQMVEQYIKDKSLFNSIELTEGHKAKSLNKGFSNIANDTLCVVIDADTIISNNFVAEIYKIYSTNKEVHVLGADYIPALERLSSSSFLYKYELFEHISRQENPFSLPIGRFMVFKKEDYSSIPEDLCGDDYYVSIDSWKRFGINSVFCDKEIKLTFFPATNWNDLILQRTRWVQGNVQLAERYPYLKEAMEGRERMVREYKSMHMDEIMDILKKKGFTEEEIQIISFIRSKLINENAEIGPSLVGENGTWIANESTRG